MEFFPANEKVPNARATPHPKFKYPPSNAKVLHSYSMKQVDYFYRGYKNVIFCILFSRQPESFTLKYKKKKKKNQRETATKYGKMPLQKVILENY